jgi:hypothetical protein
MLFALAALGTAAATLTPWTTGGFQSGKSRNLFAGVGHMEAEVSTKLKDVFADTFTGPNKCDFEVGTDMAYLSREVEEQIPNIQARGRSLRHAARRLPHRLDALLRSDVIQEGRRAYVQHPGEGHELLRRVDPQQRENKHPRQSPGGWQPTSTTSSCWRIGKPLIQLFAFARRVKRLAGHLPIALGFQALT